MAPGVKIFSTTSKLACTHQLWPWRLVGQHREGHGLPSFRGQRSGPGQNPGEIVKTVSLLIRPAQVVLGSRKSSIYWVET